MDGSLAMLGTAVLGFGLSAKQDSATLANSAFFGTRRRISNPKDAVLYLGFDTIKALTLTVKVSRSSRPPLGPTSRWTGLRAIVCSRLTFSKRLPE